MTQTETRKAEIALSKYLGWTGQWNTSLFGEGTPVLLMTAPDGSSSGPCYWDEVSELFRKFAPHWSTDESLLSPLMKGLAGKGWIVEVGVIDGEMSCEPESHGKWCGEIWIEEECRWIQPIADSPIRALFEAAIQLPEVQALLTQTTEQQ